VAADGERFDEGELLEGEIAADVEFSSGDDELRSHAAVGVDAEDLQALAAVGPAVAAGVAGGVVDVGLDGAAIAGLDVGYAVADGEHLDTELVAEDARVRHERHLAEVGADIGAADADAMDANKGVAGAGSGGLGQLNFLKGFG
jgi:hypothetical protein